MPKAYYNEIDKFAAAWLRELIKAGHIADGEVDERSIEDVKPSDLAGFSQHHFFAGIAGWSRALRLAGWPDDREVWTGSCPCQPFSAAGKGKGTEDSRHLWPIWFKLIKACKPQVIFGEQVASSLVIGKSNHDLSKLQKRASGKGLLYPHWNAQAKDLQKMQSGDCVQKIQRIGQEIYSPEGKRVQGTQTLNPQGTLFGDRSEAKSQNEKSFFRFGQALGQHSSSDRCGVLRDNGDTVRPYSKAGMEQPFARQDRPEERIHPVECQSCSILPEYHDARLGIGNSKENYEEDLTYGLVETTSQTTDEENGKVWLDAVFDDLEGASYTCGAVSFPACSFGAPHIRQRLYWVATTLGDPAHGGHTDRNIGNEIEKERSTLGGGENERSRRNDPAYDGKYGGMADSESERGGERQPVSRRGNARSEAREGGFDFGSDSSCGVADTNHQCERPTRQYIKGVGNPVGTSKADKQLKRSSPTNGHWRDADWLFCRDGRWRPVEPGTFPLVNGFSKSMVRGSDTSTPLDANKTGEAHVMRLRGYGNAIVAPQAAAFINAYMEERP